MRAIAVIETVSNQSFIFGTNRLREIVGASEMIYAAGVDLVLEACGYEKGDIERARERRGLRAIENGKGKWDDIQFLLVTSGKAILIGKRERLEEIIREVTTRALAEMPGITVHGGIADMQDDDAEGLHNAIKQAHERLAGLRSRIPSNDLRFQRLPVVAECTSSGLPAWGVDKFARKNNERDMLIVSEPVLCKRDKRMRGWSRLKNWLSGNLAGNIDDLEKYLRSKEARWVAVVHADGNGLGEIFLNFLQRLEAINIKENSPYTEYLDKYRQFSLALEKCTIAATNTAIADTWPDIDNKDKLPIIPLILGGDDLTVVCEGSRAVQFTEHFLRAFEAETGKNKNITAILPENQTDQKKPRLTACAGVAIVKPHFPFHRAYELAEALISSAKKLGKKDPENFCSALHYHVHFDSSGADWERISGQLDVPGNAHLSMQPWAVSCKDAGFRNIESLWKGIAALKAPDDEGRPRLPRSQQHALREALFAGKAIANARLKRIKHRYPDVKWDAILPSKNNLFIEEDGQFITPLLDMMDLADVMDAAEITRLVGKYRKKEQLA